MSIQENIYGEKIGAGGPLEPLGWFIIEALSRGKRPVGSSMTPRTPLRVVGGSEMPEKRSKA